MTEILCPSCRISNDSKNPLCNNCMKELNLNSRYFLLKILDDKSVTTFLAYDKREKTRVVIKEFSLLNASEWDSHDLFKKEGDILAQLNHPGIPEFIEDFEIGIGESSKSYIVMEYINGMNLKEELRKKRYTEREVIEDILEIAKILEYLHHLIPPIIHQDINLSNIMRRDDGSLVLIDFNSVKDKVIKERADNITGTFGFIAPEQLMGKTVVASDYYALGGLILLLLTRKNADELVDIDGKLNWKDSLHASKKIENLLEALLIEDSTKRVQSLKEIKKILSGREHAPVSKKRITKDNWGAVAKLRVMHGMKIQDFDIYNFPVTIGRAESRDGVQINHNSLSRKHCIISQKNGEHFNIVDLESTHGVKVNNKKVKSTPKYLTHGDKVQIGEITFKFLLKGYDEFDKIVKIKAPIKKEIIKKKENPLFKESKIYGVLAVVLFLIVGAAILFFSFFTNVDFNNSNNETIPLEENKPILRSVEKQYVVDNNLTAKELYKEGKYFQEIKNYQNANLNFTVSCDKGDTKSCEALGINYENGFGYDKDRAEAKKYYKKACKQNSGYSCNKIGKFTEKDSIYDTSYYKAKALYQKSCNLKFGLGCKNLGDFYRDGKYVKKNRRIARRYYRKACKYGYKEACKK